MGGLFDTLPPLCIDLIADELVDLSNCNLVSCYEAEGDLCHRERSLEDMFVDLCAVTATCRGLRAALGPRIVARLHDAVRAEIGASTSLHVLTQYSTHPTRLKARIESEHFPFGRPAPSDADRQQAVDYLFSKKAPKLKHLSGLSKRLVAIVRARSWATRTCAFRAYLVASCYGIDHVALEAAMPSLLIQHDTHNYALRRRDLRAAMVSVLGTTDLESARRLYASARARRAQALALSMPPGCTAADSLLMNRYISGRGDPPPLDIPPSPTLRQPVKGWAPPPSVPGGPAPPGFSRLDLSKTKKKVCVLCGERIQGTRHPELWGRWRRTCCGCAPLCVDGEGPSMVRYFMGRTETVVDRYAHDSLHTCAQCFLAEDKMARRRREVHMSCGCVFDAERAAEHDDLLFGL